MLIWLGVTLRPAILKHLGLNLSVIFIALSAFEFKMTLTNKPEIKALYNPIKPFIYNPDLGYSAREGNYSVKAIKRWPESGQHIYDVHYTFSNGLRTTPNSAARSQRHTVFLGGSFVFGEGVNDNETLPYYYNDSLSEKRSIHNYGLSGYGTHQVYTLAKNRIINDPVLAQADDVEVFYWFINAHIPRANGLAKWDRNGPLFSINDNELQHLGTFKQARQRRPLVRKLFELIWNNSAIYKRYFWKYEGTSEKHVNLVLQLVKQTDLILKRQGFKFTVIVQNIVASDTHHQQVIDHIKRYFKTHDIQFIDVNDTFKQQGIYIQKLRIKGDGHPSPKFHKSLAGLLTQSQ